jgi:membrane protein
MIDDTLKAKLATEAKARYQRANHYSRGILGVTTSAVNNFIAANAADAASSIAYYALFSLFPLLLFLIAVGSSVLKSAKVQEQVLLFAREAFPPAQELVAQNIRQILELRSTVGIVALVGLLWAATGVFTVLARHINRAWHAAETRNFLEGRLIALAMVGVLMALLFLSLVASTVFSILAQFNIGIPFLGGTSLYGTVSWRLLAALVPGLLTFVMFLGLYRWTPNTRVEWREATWGALVATIGWEITKFGFGWYIRSGLTTFDLAYGSLGAVVVLMLWIYLSSLIVLFGAHLSAAIARHSENPPVDRGRTPAAQHGDSAEPT